MLWFVNSGFMYQMISNRSILQLIAQKCYDPQTGQEIPINGIIISKI